MKTTIIRKASSLEERGQIAERLAIPQENVEISKVIKLSKTDFDSLSENLLQEREFIKDNVNEMYYDNTTKTWHCLAVICDGYDMALLIESEGYDYPRYTGIISKSEVDK